MMAETTLLPCPFCGGEASRRLFYGARYGVYCDECDARVGGLFNTEAEAIAAWNARAERGTLTADDIRDLIERHSDASGGNGRDFHNGAYKAIADELNTRAERHAYEQRITGSGSDWGEIMCDAFDSLLASACDACTFDELERFRAYIIKEVGE